MQYTAKWPTGRRCSPQHEVLAVIVYEDGVTVQYGVRTLAGRPDVRFPRLQSLKETEIRARFGSVQSSRTSTYDVHASMVGDEERLTRVREYVMGIVRLET